MNQYENLLGRQTSGIQMWWLNRNLSFRGTTEWQAKSKMRNLKD